jgi:hypothetical protein
VETRVVSVVVLAGTRGDDVLGLVDILSPKAVKQRIIITLANSGCNGCGFGWHIKKQKEPYILSPHKSHTSMK